MEMMLTVFLMRHRESTMLRIRRRLRDASDPFSTPENEFTSIYSRLSREAVWMLIEELRPLLPVPKRRHAVPVELQVLCALNFIAAGSYQKRVGQDYLTCMSQPTVSKVLRNVVNALNVLMDRWIKFPIEDDVQRIKESYWRHTEFPGVIGAVDGTHIAIVPPSAGREHLYLIMIIYNQLNSVVTDSSLVESIGPLYVRHHLEIYRLSKLED
ncbi:PREDICTED: uncharacterized protein LOC105561292 [Vollenhovia emeryi]|uniref:uncharacterized protein LOC105561292 n=1 Tax=Vollenhovia emeryi TaxID=411798 RepID=UPI0005F3CC40|nr:PREDICTED: uncharacterized protein LOC105561292 [Vollenhovia emeryi]